MTRPKAFHALPCIALLLVACGDEPDRITDEGGPPVFDSAEALVQGLARAYENRDVELFGALLAGNTERNAEFVFFLSEPTEFSEVQWDRDEEVRIHRRMFEPSNPIGGEDPVAPDLWLQAVDINLQPLAPFQEREDLYSPQSDDANCPGGKCADGKLDRRIWKAMDAQYSTDVFFQLAGEIDYQVSPDNKANFVVIEDLTKKLGDDGKFLLLIWGELRRPFKPDPGTSATEGRTWAGIKSIYR